MESLADNILIKELSRINNVYGSSSFVDIDFIKLFDLVPTEKNKLDDPILIKKKIMNKFYALAIKYHPDKYSSNEDTTAHVNILDNFVLVEDIKNGSFMGFVEDIRKTLIDVLEKEPQTVINIINGDISTIFGNYDPNSDFVSLKRRFDSNINKDYIKPTQDQLDTFNFSNTKISDTRIDDKEIMDLISSEVEKREKLKIDNIFSGEDQNDKNFNAKFNEAFETAKFSTLNTTDNLDTEPDAQTFNIQPFNSNSDFNFNLNLTTTNTNAKTFSQATSLDEAFGVINVNPKNVPSKQKTYEELLSEREEQINSFKIKLNKSS